MAFYVRLYPNAITISLCQSWRYPKNLVNILGVPALGTFFGDNSDATGPLAEDDTTIKSGAIKSHLIWYHGRNEWHFMYGCIRMP